MRKNKQGLKFRTKTRPLVSATRTAQPNVVLRVSNQVSYIVKFATAYNCNDWWHKIYRCYINTYASLKDYKSRRLNYTSRKLKQPADFSTTETSLTEPRIS